MAYVHAYRRFDRSVQRNLPMVDLRKLRRRLKLSQRMFARRYGVPVETLRHWEQGDRRPSGAALALLNLVVWQPILVFHALDRIEREKRSGRFFQLRLNSRHPVLSKAP
jgi:DNA-binding transcriptional regulator YiaG